MRRGSFEWSNIGTFTVKATSVIWDRVLDPYLGLLNC